MIKLNKGIDKHWYANKVAKLYLAGTDSVELLEEGVSKNEDFVIRSTKNGEKYIVDVKPSKYSLAQTKKEYKDLREDYSTAEKPVIMMYINYLKKTGFFEVIANGKSVNITELA